MVNLLKCILIVTLSLVLLSSSGTGQFVSLQAESINNSTSSQKDGKSELSKRSDTPIPRHPDSSPSLIEPNHAPRAEAGPDVMVNERQIVLLDGGKSTDIDGDKLSFAWTQVSPKEPKIDLNNPRSEGPSFVAPDVEKSTTFTLMLVVEDGKGGKSNDKIRVRVNNIVEDRLLNTQPDMNERSSTVIGQAVSKETVKLDDRLSARSAQSSILATEACSIVTFVCDVNEGEAFSETFTWGVVHLSTGGYVQGLIAHVVKQSGPADLQLSSIDGNPATVTFKWDNPKPSGTYKAVFALQILFCPASQTKACNDFLNNRNDPVTFTINVNGKPTANEQSVSTIENTPKAITLTGSDPNNDPLTFTVTSSPAHGSLTGTAPSLTYTPANLYAGDDQFNFKVNDGKLDSNEATVSIIIEPKNTPPNPQATVLPSNTVISGTAVTLDGSASTDKEDPPQALKFSWMHLGTDSIKLSNAKTAKATFIAPVVTSPTIFSFQLTVTDSESAQGLTVVKVTVKPRTNTAPTANSQTISTDKNTSKAITLTGSDPDNDPLTFKIVTNPAHGSLTGTAPSVTYTPEEDYTGADRFFFIVNDGKQDSGIATVSITISPQICSTTAQTSLISAQQLSGCRMTMTASPTQLSPLVPMPSSIITARVVDGSGKPVSGLLVHFSSCTTIGSGGHTHDTNNGEGCSSRPLASLSLRSSLIDITNKKGEINVRYVPPTSVRINPTTGATTYHVISGEDTVTAVARVADNVGTLTADLTANTVILTKVPDLVSFTDPPDICAVTAFYTITRQDNHACLFYGTVDTNQATRDIAAQFNNLQTVCSATGPDRGCLLSRANDDRTDRRVSITGVPVPLRINAMSLPWGGLSDIQGNWLPSHFTHKTGKEVDLGFANLDNDRRLLLRFIVNNHLNLRDINTCEGGTNIITPLPAGTCIGFPRIADHIHATFRN